MYAICVGVVCGRAAERPEFCDGGSYAASSIAMKGRVLWQRLRRYGQSSGWQVLALLLVVWGVQTWRTWEVPVGAAPDFMAPARRAGTVATLGSDEMLNFASWRTQHAGQPVALHFWAQWCPVCKLEEPMVDALAAHAPVLTVATQSGDLHTVQKTLTQRGRDWSVVNDPTGDLRRLYGVSVLPAWVIVDAQGHIRASTTGYTSTWGLRLRLWWAAAMPVM